METHHLESLKSLIRVSYSIVQVRMDTYSYLGKNCGDHVVRRVDSDGGQPEP